MPNPYEPDWERLAIRMIHKVCDAKETHATLEGICPRCGLSSRDVDKHLTELRA